MRILLDSNVVLWLALVPERLSRVAAESIEKSESSGTAPAITSASLYEIAYLIRCGRVASSIPEVALLARVRNRFELIPVSGEIATCAAQFGPHLQGDPIDRMIAATAVVENRTLITADRRLLQSGVCKTLW